MKADDQEAYMRLVKESKNERLTTLLEETNKLLVNLGAAVQRQKDVKYLEGIESLKDSGADSPELDEDLEVSYQNDASSDLLEGQRQYNSAIHSIQEKVIDNSCCYFLYFMFFVLVYDAWFYVFGSCIYLPVKYLYLYNYISQHCNLQLNVSLLYV